MKLLGTVVKTCGSRLLIVRCDAARLPRLYGDVFSRRLRPIGKVVDIFGNVASPYAAVFCRGDHSQSAGEKLYTKGDGKWQKSRN
ncbi:RNA-binding protein [Methanofollis formosanus]|uniref:RNA-binding protein n=1 Tax=Methanofollis formosanus TaxID=299308 RepID=A0A8G1EGK2_9EURY|nr:RNA-binding protein [Methanofollis formosanus]